MTRYQPIWMQGGSYAALNDRMLVAAALGGHANVVPAGGCAGMVPSVQTGTMNVQFSAGRAVVPISATDPQAWLCVADALDTLGLPQAPPTGQNRYDLLIVRPRDPAVNASYTQNDWIYDYVSGAASSSPTPPTAASAPAGTLALGYVLVIGGAASIVAGNLTDIRPPIGGFPYVARIYRAAGMNTTNAGHQAISCDNANDDPWGGFTAGGWTVPASGAGRYQVNACTGITSGTANEATTAGVFLNGTLYGSGAMVRAPATTGNMKGMYSDQLRLAAGDRVQLSVFAQNARALVVGSTESFLALHRIGT